MMDGERRQTSSPVMTEDRNAGPAASPSVSGSEDGASHPENPQTESLKRKRPATTACEMCKSRKVKCDRAEPTCGWCARHNRECIYRERQKPGFRAAYGRELEEKISALEMKLNALGHRVDQHQQILGTDSNKRLDGTPQANMFTPNHNQAFELRPPSAAVSSANTGFQNSPVRDDRYEGMHQHRLSEPMSVRSMVNLPESEDASRQQASAGLAPQVNHAQPGHMPDADLPPPDLLYTIVDLYFKHVNTWCPILDRQVTFDEILGSTSRTEPDRILLYAIVATTLRFSRDPRLTPESRKHYHDIAKQKVLLHGMERPGIWGLKALVILTMDILGTPSGPHSWNILGLIVQNTSHLGLFTEKRMALDVAAYNCPGSLHQFALPRPTSWIEEEGRRRVFWMAYILDRYAALDSGSDFTIDERETDRPLPCRYDLFSKNEPVETRWFRGPDQSELTVNRPENLGSFSYHCEVLRILSRIHNFLRKPLDIGSLSEVEEWQNTYRKLDGELNNWLCSLPDDYSRISQLCHSDPTSRISNWIMLHAAFVISVIRLHSCAAYPTVRSHIFTRSYNAMQRCLSSVESLKEIAQDVINTGMLDLLGPHFAFALWVSARLLLIHASATENDVDGSIDFYISSLKQMGRNWDVARDYAQVLEHIIQENQESKRVRYGSHSSSPSFQPRTLGSMRRSAYNLSLLMAQHRSSSILKPTSVKTLSTNELEYFDVFDFFNYPRLPAGIVNGPTGPEPFTSPENSSPMKDYYVTTNFALSNSESSDWLSFRPPQD